ncbi:hypothetical protein LCGC14_0909440 [marine sediment metagenome]|uniref:Uncharacterized protein n=1 Tax=marine sediment metagenome TaxID=412755 RepID=A0A0F9PEW3_9ZZZZ
MTNSVTFAVRAAAHDVVNGGWADPLVRSFVSPAVFNAVHVTVWFGVGREVTGIKWLQGYGAPFGAAT